MIEVMDSTDAAAHELSTLLWRERELLDLLVFKLEEERLLLAAGASRWLPYATREVEQVLDRLRKAGLDRAIAVSSLAEDWGVAEQSTLRELVDAAPSAVWRDLFAQHLAALTELAAQIAEVRDANLAYLHQAARSAHDVLAAVDPAAGTYDARGAAAHGPTGPHLVERDL